MGYGDSDDVLVSGAGERPCVLLPALDRTDVGRAAVVIVDSDENAPAGEPFEAVAELLDRGGCTV
jgi:hypothetical protein